MVEMGVADQVALDPGGEHVARPALVGIGRHRDGREGALLLGDAQAVHQGAGVTGHGAIVTVRMDERGAEVAVLDAAQGAQHDQIEAIGGDRPRRAGQERRHGKDGDG